MKIAKENYGNIGLIIVAIAIPLSGFFLLPSDFQVKARSQSIETSARATCLPNQPRFLEGFGVGRVMDIDGGNEKTIVVCVDHKSNIASIRLMGAR